MLLKMLTDVAALAFEVLVENTVIERISRGCRGNDEYTICRLELYRFNCKVG